MSYPYTMIVILEQGYIIKLDYCFMVDILLLL